MNGPTVHADVNTKNINIDPYASMQLQDKSVKLRFLRLQNFIEKIFVRMCSVRKQPNNSWEKNIRNFIILKTK